MRKSVCGQESKEKGGRRRVKRAGARTEIERCEEPTTSLGFSTYQDMKKPLKSNGGAQQRRWSQRKTDTEVKRSSSRKEAKESPPSGTSPAV